MPASVLHDCPRMEREITQFSRGGNSMSAQDQDSGDLKKLLFTPSSIVLILMNCIPIWGVFFRDWDVGFILAIYWAENVAVGLINILKLLTNRSESAVLPAKLFMTPFFTVHYGIFTLVHGVFVFTVFQEGGPFGSGGGPSGSPFSMIGSQFGGLWFPFLGFFASHLFSFFYNYLGQGECKRIDLPIVMFLPYPRIVVLHLVIIFGGFITMALGSPKPVIFLLVIVKTVGDLFFHSQEHKKSDSGTQTTRS